MHITLSVSQNVHNPCLVPRPQYFAAVNRFTWPGYPFRKRNQVVVKARVTAVQELGKHELTSSNILPAASSLFARRGRRYSPIWAIKACAAPKAIVFQPFLVMNRVLILPFWSYIGYGFCTLVLN